MSRRPFIRLEERRMSLHALESRVNQKLVDYGENHPSHSDVLALLAASKPDEAAAAVITTTSEEKIGFVYLLKANGIVGPRLARSTEAEGISGAEKHIWYKVPSDCCELVLARPYGPSCGDGPECHAPNADCRPG